MNANLKTLLSVIVAEYQKTGKPVPRNRIWRDLMPEAYPPRHNKNGRPCGGSMSLDKHLDHLINMGCITVLKRGNGKDTPASGMNTSLITPTPAGLQHTQDLTPAQGQPQGQQTIPLANEINRREIEAKDREIAALRQVIEHKEQRINDLKRKISKLAELASVDDLIAML